VTVVAHGDSRPAGALRSPLPSPPSNGMIGNAFVEARHALGGYAELDLRLGWHVSDHWELSLVGQNLLHDEHVEFGPAVARGAIERAAYVKAAWRN